MFSSTCRCGSMAEQLICNQQVIGSSPIIGSSFIYGGIPEWPKGTDCKSAGTAFSGSNPLSPTRREICKHKTRKCYILSRGRAVRKLVGLITRRSQVQILSPQFHALVAQMVEQRTENPCVTGSIPVQGTFLLSGCSGEEKLGY